MVSDPAIRSRIEAIVREKGVVEAGSAAELKEKLGMTDVSNTKFSAALKSIGFSGRPTNIRIVRTPRDEAMSRAAPRNLHVSYV